MLNFGNRIVNIREKLKMSQQEFAKKIGILPQALARYEKNKSTPSIEFSEKLTNLFNVNSNWLLTGKGSMFINDTQDNNCTNDSCYQVEKLSLQASAGTGIINHEVTSNGTMLLPKDLFKTPQNPDNLKIIQVTGDSMQPTIQDGAFVVIDTSQNQVIDGGIYAILLDDQIMIKRLQKTPQGIEILSDNKNYTPIHYNPKEQQDITFKILGKKLLIIQ